MMNYWGLLFSFLLSFCSLVSPIQAAGREQLTVELADTLVHQLSNRLPKGMSFSMLRQAQGVLIIPQANQIGLVQLGGACQGIFMARLPNGGWSNPLFIRFAGTRVVQEHTGKMAEIIILFHNQHAIQQLMKKKQTLGVDLTLNAGEQQNGLPEIANSDITGFWMGGGEKPPSLRGAVVDIDADTNKDFYRFRTWSPEAFLSRDPLPATFGLSSELTRISHQAFTNLKAIEP